MNASKWALYIGLPAVLMVMLRGCRWLDHGFESRWNQTPQRVWVGPDYWANRLQDWRVHKGRLECVNTSRAMRTLHILTRHLNRKQETFTMHIQTGTLSESARRADAWCGFLIGAGSLKDDYRMRSLIHQAYGQQGGLIAGVNGKGELILLDNENKRKNLPLKRSHHYNPPGIPESGIDLTVKAKPTKKSYILTLRAESSASGKTIDSAYIDGIKKTRLQGNIALTAHTEDNSYKKSFWFNHWKIKGAKIHQNDARKFGPILGAHYTLSRGSLRMTAQMPPLAKEHLQKVKLEIRECGKDEWKKAGRSKVITPGWIATFHIKDWNSHKKWEYRLSYPLKESPELLYFKGIIQKEPEKEALVAAGMHNIGILNRGLEKKYDFSGDSIWFPQKNTINNILRHKPHIVLYTGNQIHRDLPATVKNDTTDDVYLDYLYKWYLFCWSQGSITRNTPSILLPGPADRYQLPSTQTDSQPKHTMPAAFVNMVQRSQTSHLPEPYDPSPISRGIPAFYTSLQYGGVDFAILSPAVEEHAPGQRQLTFLEKWNKNWTGAHIKALISQETISGKNSSTKQALKSIRKAHGMMITSGLPAAYARHHTIEKPKDAGLELGLPPFSFNPIKKPNHQDTEEKYETGYGIIRFNTKLQKMTFSAWPGKADPSKDDPFPGWPLTLRVEDNYPHTPTGYLPEIIIKGLNHKPVYKLFHDNDPQMIYAKRATDSIFRPRVFDESVYTLVVEAPEEKHTDTLRNLVPVKLKKQIILDFRQR